MKSVCNCNLFLYADDSALVFSNKDIKVIENHLSDELQNISEWLIENKLSLHLGKTESILFGSKIRLSRTPELKISLGGIQIEAKNCVKYLGCDLDSSVSGESMSQKVVKKVNQRIKFLARKAQFLNKETLKMLANALIQPHFDYACTTWYSSTPKRIKVQLQTAQNKLVRLILNLNYREHIGSSELKKLKWLTVENRVRQLKLRLTRKILYKNEPRYFKDYFKLIRNSHSYSTRGSATDIVPCRFKTCSGQNTFLYMAAMEWNKLPVGIKLSQSDCCFNRACGEWLLNAN